MQGLLSEEQLMLDGNMNFVGRMTAVAGENTSMNCITIEVEINTRYISVLN